MKKRKESWKRAACAFFCSLILIVFCKTGNAAEYTYTQGGKYTPMGADPKGGENGEIPPFEGSKGLKCPEGWENGDFYPNPWPDEKPLYRIDHTNVEKYKHRLSPGQVAWLKKVPERYMNIYPGHRVYEFPDIFYKATEKNLKTCYIDDKNDLQGHSSGLPFVFPKNALEMAWNLKKPWVGPDTIDDACLRIVSPTGKIRKKIRRIKSIMMGEQRLIGEKIPNPNGYDQLVMMYTLHPPDQRGEIILAKRYLDDNKDSDAWQYMPTLRRVKRAPSVDASKQGDGERVLDDSPAALVSKIWGWNWELLPRQAMYIPVNNYDLWKLDATDEEECWVGTPNPERYRYELRRCWVLVATIAKDYNHPYSKRVYYIDEDAINISIQDMYDKRGNLWRHMEGYNEHGICTNIRFVHGQCTINLESLRYEIVGGCRTKDTKTNITNTGQIVDDYSVQALRKLGR